MASGPVILTGANGAGKTNLLEAVSFLVPGRGLRGARLSDIAHQATGQSGKANGWAVAAQINTPSGQVELGTGSQQAQNAYGPSDKRVVRIEGETVRSQALLAEYMSAHWLTPQMDRLFTEGASGRRRFLDRMVFGRDPAHAGRVSAYEHALRERSRLLQEGSADPVWLSALEETLAEKGVAVTAARCEQVTRLAEVCEAGIGPFPGALINLEGELESWLGQGPALAAEDRFRDTLARSRLSTAEKGRPPVGPHRSDLQVIHRPKGQNAALCSTGEQKALLIALVLGNAMLSEQHNGQAPVLLLDEVAAHLDEDRRGALYERLLDLKAQVWMTGTDQALFETLKGRGQFFNVSDARVTPTA